MTAISADRPSSNPQDDLFGHAPFAESLANSICRYPGNDGLVLALYGPWGSGKSTVLNYVRHFLEQRPEAEQPVIVTFNPWWFSGPLSASAPDGSAAPSDRGGFSLSVLPVARFFTLAGSTPRCSRTRCRFTTRCSASSWPRSEPRTLA